MRNLATQLAKLAVVVTASATSAHLGDLRVVSVLSTSECWLLIAVPSHVKYPLRHKSPQLSVNAPNIVFAKVSLSRSLIC